MYSSSPAPHDRARPKLYVEILVPQECRGTGLRSSTIDVRSRAALGAIHPLDEEVLFPHQQDWKAFRVRLDQNNVAS
ncbi:hypothetical protein BT69DRAFT_1291270 [Atractiella rhizophila]|nr:hypothetical protein BT69DRAFT_1291270 [Atractiella rhizophila]